MESTVRKLLSEEQLREGVHNLAAEINASYGDRPLTVVGLMTGSIILLADVIRLLRMPLRVGVLQTSSYREGTERGELFVNSDMMLDIAGRDLLIIDDIFDTGHTMTRVVERVQAYQPTSVRTAVLLSKSGRAEVDWQPDFIVFDIPDEFVVGYGLDYCDQYRNLPYVAVLEPADLQSPCR